MRVSDIAIIFMYFSIPGPFWVPSSLDVHVALVVLFTLQGDAYKNYTCKIDIYKTSLLDL